MIHRYFTISSTVMRLPTKQHSFIHTILLQRIGSHTTRLVIFQETVNVNLNVFDLKSLLTPRNEVE